MTGHTDSESQDAQDTSEDIAEVKENLRETEEEVEQLREQVKKMMPSRRDVLKAGGAAALFGAGAVGGASADPGDDGDTVWGSASNRDDYYVDEMDANTVSTDNLSLTNGQQGFDFKVYRDSGEYVVIDGDTFSEVFREPNTDNAENAFQHAIDNLPTRGGTIAVESNAFRFSSEATVSSAGVSFNGESLNGTEFVAATAINSFIKIQGSSRIARAGDIEDIHFNGANNATHAIYVDSSRHGTISNCSFTDVNSAPVYATSAQATAETDQWTVRDCNTSGCGFMTTDFATGGVADWTIESVYIEGLDSWGLDLQDADRMRVSNVFAGNNSSTFDGAVRLENPSRAIGGSTIKNIGIENLDGTNAAVGVHVDATSANNNEDHTIEGVRASPSNAITMVRLRATNSGSTRSIKIKDPRIPANAADSIDVGSGVVDTKIEYDIENLERDDYLTDSGIRTAVNRVGRNAGNPNNGGDWQGKGYDGMRVEDVNNAGDLYEYLSNANAWTQIGT